MATFIQEDLKSNSLRAMSPGERRFTRCLKSMLEDDYICWYDIPVGKQQRYPDFIILHPARGLLFLEVKDWKLSSIKSLSKERVSLLTPNGQKSLANPFTQVRQCSHAAINQLEKDPFLHQTSERYSGKLCFPYAWGVVFTNITREQINKAIPEEHREGLLPDRLMLYQEDIRETVDAEIFQSQLWGMFNYHFPEQLTLPQMDRIRWHLFPEMRINAPVQPDFFTTENTSETIPDIVRVMDIQQEVLARSLGEGHRIIHGVAGSGKTLILGYRAEALAPLAETRKKPVLILCFNTSLAAKLRHTMAHKGLAEWIHIHHFHEWCGLQLRSYNVDVIHGQRPYYEREVLTVIEAVKNKRIPRAQYSALLIDEGHDFESEWLNLIVQMIDPETNSLLFLYDDAQSIYKRKSTLNFSLASVGIQAQGRTSILRMNYRNTREILDFAYHFAKDFFDGLPKDADLGLVHPEAAGSTGEPPRLSALASWKQEVEKCIAALIAWHKGGYEWRDMAIIYPSHFMGKAVADELTKVKIPYLWMINKESKRSYDPIIDRVTLLTIQSSKGLEFRVVSLIGAGHLKSKNISECARLLYVGMTRAQCDLHISYSIDNELTQRLRNS